MYMHISPIRFWRLTFDGDQASRPGFGWQQDVPVTWPLDDSLGISLGDFREFLPQRAGKTAMIFSMEILE